MQDYILISPVERPLSSVLTVITNQTDQNTWGAFGDVVAVGPGKRSKKGKIIPVGSKVGDRVLYGGAGLGCIKFPKVVEDGQEYLIIQDADVVCVYTEQ